ARLEQAGVTLWIGKRGDAAAGVEKKDIFSEAIRRPAQLFQHAAKGFSGVNRIEQHAFLPGKLEIKAEVFLAREAVTGAEMAIEYLEDAVARREIEFSRGLLNELADVLLEIDGGAAAVHTEKLSRR